MVVCEIQVDEYCSNVRLFNILKLFVCFYIVQDVYNFVFVEGGLDWLLGQLIIIQLDMENQYDWFDFLRFYFWQYVIQVGKDNVIFKI